MKASACGYRKAPCLVRQFEMEILDPTLMFHLALTFPITAHGWSDRVRDLQDMTDSSKRKNSRKQDLKTGRSRLTVGMSSAVIRLEDSDTEIAPDAETSYRRAPNRPEIEQTSKTYQNTESSIWAGPAPAALPPG